MDERQAKERVLALYIADTLNSHNFWALKLLLTEFFNLANVIGNIYFINVFLAWEFTTYGIDVLNFMEDDPETRVDPMATIFPSYHTIMTRFAMDQLIYVSMHTIA